MNISNKLHLASYLVKRAIFDDIRNAYNAYQTYKDFKGKYDNLSGTIQQGLGQFNSMLGQGGLSQLGNTIQQGISGVMQGFNTNPQDYLKSLNPQHGQDPGFAPQSMNKSEDVLKWNTPDKDYIPPSGNQYQNYLKSLNPQHGQDSGFAPQSGTPSYQGARRMPYRPSSSSSLANLYPNRPSSSQAPKPQVHLL